MRRFIALATLIAALLLVWSGPFGDEAPGSTGPELVTPNSAARVFDESVVDVGPVVQIAPSRFTVGACKQDTGQAEFDRPTLGAYINVFLDEFRARLQNVRLDRPEESVFGIVAEIMRGATDEAHLSTLLDSPGRRIDGFDLATAVFVTLGLRAKREGDLSAGLGWARRGSKEGPDDPVALVFQSLMSTEQARKSGRDLALLRESRASLGRAFRLEPEEPGIALALGMRLSESGASTDALQALDRYLEGAPDDQRIEAVRDRLEIRASLEQGFAQLTRGGLEVFYPPDMSGDQARSVLGQVQEALADAALLTGTTARQDLSVVVYGTRTDMLAATCTPSWTDAVFDGMLRLHKGVASESARSRSVIRHESLHAQLEHAVRRAPTWLHEGLAQYLSDEKGEGHRKSFALMVSQRTWIPFPSIEGSFTVIEDKQSARLAYHQSLAMVEALVDLGGPSIMARTTKLLADGLPAEQLLAQLTSPPLTGERMLDYLARQD